MVITDVNEHRLALAKKMGVDVALNTGHGGALSTVHANSPAEAPTGEQAISRVTPAPLRHGTIG